MTTLTVRVPIKTHRPRGAWMFAALFARLLRAMDRAGAAVADRHDRRVAQSDAARVRRYANDIMPFDPRFAADLFAAADRHEREAGLGD